MGIKQILADRLLDIYTYPLNVVIRRMNQSHKIAFQTKLFKHIKDEDNYVSLSFMPVHVSDINIGRLSDRDYSDTAIVLQGAVTEKNNFTAETVELYKKYYKGIHIVVSTWEDTSEETVQTLRDAGAEIIRSKYPYVNGVGNMNYQLVSSKNGVDYAKKLGLKYVWKTRTDQRYYNPCALSCLFFSLKEKRLVMLGGIYNSFVKRIFDISDFMAFGTINEMMVLYDQQLDNEDSSKTKYTHKNAKNDANGFNQYMNDVKQSENGLLDIGTKYEKLAIECGNPETLITFNYYKAISEDKNLTELSKKYVAFLKNNIGIIDADSLGFFWVKYDYDSIRQNYFDRMGKLDYARWTSIQDIEA